MAQTFFEDLETAMYPSALLHTFGVNGKVSGSVGAIGEMSQDVAAVIHGASRILWPANRTVPTIPPSLDCVRTLIVVSARTFCRVIA